ncbi:hypothetical protein IC762_25470 [Bradyrhizobium genosp. L]|uniref:hypothetical protein n=1 Tax=Bradyrhizobium genosp. L TaxID=83637 RepID=UPI0018A2E914|nr:hypothetical protein [Bradyrhizobium genosp. L]QPF83067.1 hypothetical protein IC762_25470 [Bradyrhizobium genosp. L]
MSGSRLSWATAEHRPDRTVFRFSTADYAPQDRLDAWREVYGNTLCKQEIEPVDSGNLDANVLFCRLPGLATMRGDLFQALYRRKPYQVESDRLFIAVGLASSFEVEQLSRNALVRVGDGFIGGRGAACQPGCGGLSLADPIDARARHCSNGP